MGKPRPIKLEYFYGKIECEHLIIRPRETPLARSSQVKTFRSTRDVNPIMAYGVHIGRMGSVSGMQPGVVLG